MDESKTAMTTNVPAELSDTTDRTHVQEPVVELRQSSRQIKPPDRACLDL